ncbi:actin depolymerizing protein [Lindgomyces ingoldianus]|uniref:Actin depolymerizing protein n=1 Tax=Lindgomyces ingoldianus TaxID=673940 RepID=A0ACB6QB55_9PLEO|nr:actin depolymerizing protein [Lindgomyces ingoldianus]KAF2464163.1 actin depolymerizing protein [Lindgomyces ingoldianus]
MPAPSDILSDVDIAQAYEDVRSDKSETTWLVLKYASGTPDSLKLDKTGTGDIAEMCECLGDDEAAYGYVRVTLGNDEYSERTKFAFVVWAGPNTKIMRKAKMSFQSGQVKQVLRSYAVEIQTDDKKDLEQEVVVMKLRKAMGANYDRQKSTY